MSADGYVGDDLDFAAFLSYIGFVLLSVEVLEAGRSRFTFDAPSLDCEAYHTDFKNGQLGITDYFAVCQERGKLLRILKQLRMNGDEQWCSPEWVAGRG